MLLAVDLAAVAGGDAGALLAAMLQRVQAQIGEVGGFRMAVDGENAALIVNLSSMLVVYGCQLSSSEFSKPLQTVLSATCLDQSTFTDPFLIRNRNRSFIVTPMRRLRHYNCPQFPSTASGPSVEIRMRDGPSWNSSELGPQIGVELDRRPCRSTSIPPAPPPGRRR
jgi:hypothetical protein